MENFSLLFGKLGWHRLTWCLKRSAGAALVVLHKTATVTIRTPNMLKPALKPDATGRCNCDQDDIIQ